MEHVKLQMTALENQGGKSAGQIENKKHSGRCVAYLPDFVRTDILQSILQR